jgi:hypothetical protein
VFPIVIALSPTERTNDAFRDDHRGRGGSRSDDRCHGPDQRRFFRHRRRAIHDRKLGCWFRRWCERHRRLRRCVERLGWSDVGYRRDLVPSRFGDAGDKRPLAWQDAGSFARAVRHLSGRNQLPDVLELPALTDAAGVVDLPRSPFSH